MVKLPNGLRHRPEGVLPEWDTCLWVGVDSAWEQGKLEARKMLENAAESHTSGARFVVPPLELTSSCHYFINIIIRKACQFTNLLYKNLFSDMESTITFCKRHHIY